MILHSNLQTKTHFYFICGNLNWQDGNSWSDNHATINPNRRAMFNKSQLNKIISSVVFCFNCNCSKGSLFNWLYSDGHLFKSFASIDSFQSVLFAWHGTVGVNWALLGQQTGALHLPPLNWHKRLTSVFPTAATSTSVSNSYSLPNLLSIHSLETGFINGGGIRVPPLSLHLVHAVQRRRRRT